MNVFAILMFASPALLLILTVFLVIIVTGIRRGDRDDLARPARNRVDAISRRMAGLGVRDHAGREEGDL